MATPIKLSLLENSHAFLREGVAKVLLARSDPSQWQFALLHLVQALELSLKAALRQVHPVLVFEDVDTCRNMVTTAGALRRLESARIGGHSFSEGDKTKIQKAITLRNQIVHAEFELTDKYAAAKFIELFAFVSEFQRNHLKSKVSEIIPEDNFTELVKIKDLVDELANRARDRISKENIDRADIWECPNCGEDAFVIKEGTDTCYACSYSEILVECPQCSAVCFESELDSFFEDLDTDYDEGQTVIHNDFGYRKHEACPECLPKIRDDIKHQREEEEFFYLNEEYEARRRLTRRCT